VLQPAQVKQFALERGLPVLQPEKMKDPAFVEALRQLGGNLQVVVAFRMLLEVVWAMPEYGTFNVHAALLPQYRGAAPINWAIINGEQRSGVTTFFLDHDIDTGRIIMQLPFAIPDDADVEYVYDGLMHLGAEICLQTLDRIIAADGHPASTPQITDSLTRELKPAPKIFKETCEISWSQSAKQVYDFVRGLSPYPGAWTTLVAPDGKTTVLKVFRTTKTGQPSRGGVGSLCADKHHLYVSASDQLLQIDELQLAGKKRMDAQAFLNGMKEIENYSLR
jgi:methionyl-tRNA formyltransferase